MGFAYVGHWQTASGSSDHDLDCDFDTDFPSERRWCAGVVCFLLLILTEVLSVVEKVEVVFREGQAVGAGTDTTGA